MFLVDTVLGIGKDWLKSRNATRQIELEGKVEVARAKVKATIEQVAQGSAHAAQMDQLSVGQRGWKDDYLLILTTLPLVLLFAAPLLGAFAGEFSPEKLTRAVLDGFTALESTPEYYWYGLAVIYIDTFGFRRMLRAAVEGYVNKKLGG